jgi:hypothetical protein
MLSARKAHSSAAPRLLALVALLALTVTALLSADVAEGDHGLQSGQSFTTLQAPFTQEIFGVSPHFMGGVAFDPTDGDPWVNDCAFSGSELHRFDRQGVAPEDNATRLHPMTTHPSNAGCGLTNHPDGSLYTNTSAGVVNLSASTGAQLRSAFGPGGNALGIAPDPQTGNLVYVGSGGTIHFVDASFTTSGTFSSVTTGNFVDGIYFDPSGNFLFMANRSPSFRLTIVDRTGALVQHVPMSAEPDGIAFRATSPKFVVTNNLDGTLTRFDFAGDDYTQVPTQSTLASGGFRGDLSQVGPDACLYLTQDGTRYDNGTVSSENSLVRICPGFNPPPGIEGPPGNANCSDGIDNDGDTLVDLNDPDCVAPPEVCDNGADDDGDTLVDLNDPDCAAPPEICDNGVDDDGDTLVDLNDPDCSTQPCPPDDDDDFDDDGEDNEADDDDDDDGQADDEDDDDDDDGLTDESDGDDDNDGERDDDDDFDNDSFAALLDGDDDDDGEGDDSDGDDDNDGESDSDDNDDDNDGESDDDDDDDGDDDDDPADDCDDDDDDDGVGDTDDNCQQTPNPLQGDDDDDGHGDDCDDGDGDGFVDADELQIGTLTTDRCSFAGWPANTHDEASSTNKLDVQDVLSFVAPIRRLDTSDGEDGFSARWDLTPGSGVLGSQVNIQDITALLGGVTARPAMFGGQTAFGRTCTAGP